MATHPSESMNISADKGTQEGTSHIGQAMTRSNSTQVRSLVVQALVSAASETGLVQEWFDYIGFDSATMRLAHRARQRLENENEVFITVTITRGKPQDQ